MKKVLCLVLDEEGQSGEVSVLFTDDGEIAELNHLYRKKNKPTDVLAFPSSIPAGYAGPPVLGDIVISIPTAKKQAVLLRHSLDHEIAFLLIHGMLHLLGYDHHTSSDRKKMFSRQDKIFAKVGAGSRE